MKIIFEYEEENSEHVEDEDICIELPSNLVRKELPIPDISEVNVVRHFTNLSRMNFGVDVGFYPLGSCTMKYNPRVNEDPARADGFSNLHPLSRKESVKAPLQLMWELKEILK